MVLFVWKSKIEKLISVGFIYTYIPSFMDHLLWSITYSRFATVNLVFIKQKKIHECSTFQSQHDQTVYVVLLTINLLIVAYYLANSIELYVNLVDLELYSAIMLYRWFVDFTSKSHFCSWPWSHYSKVIYDNQQIACLW